MRYAQRNEEMRRLRFEEGWILRDIAEKFGVSRERVRQIIGNTGKEFRKEWTKKFIQGHPDVMIGSHFTEISSLPGVKKAWQTEWGNYPHKMKGEYQKKHRNYENETKRMLRNIGIKAAIMPTKNPFNLITHNGCRIVVRYTTTNISECPSQTSSTYPHWAVPGLPNNHRDYDFLIAFIPDTFFVIPSNEIGDRNPTSRIRIPWPKMSNKPSKWHKWHERIDMIY